MHTFVSALLQSMLFQYLEQDAGGHPVLQDSRATAYVLIESLYILTTLSRLYLIYERTLRIDKF
ncbi:hypothetical protein CC86DRAFT_37812 [Ophiobolus disseminans]|uniref:Uncharacterized protein n=1 Tax=Ophiobolus disseminans TaxID=1469910 RepID=A0A6A6ZYQ6_9PLEO|nr:hypothetical protein CC86DRAFT_37812 [Ophiobolus disseminans]